MKITFGVKLTALVLILVSIVMINQDKPLIVLPYSVLLTYVLFRYGSYYAGAPYFPTPRSTARKMVSAVKIKGKTVYDLGSGDGRIIILAAKKGADAYGIEGDFFRWIYSLIRIREAKVKAAVFWNNFFWVNLSKADVIFVSFRKPSGKTIENLQEKLLKELKPGSFIVSRGFMCKKLRLDKSLKKEDIYAYRIPRKK